MYRELQITADGSHTVAVPELHVTCHSTFGAIQESQHVFIEAGLSYVTKCDSAVAEACANTSEGCVNAEQPFFLAKQASIRVSEMGFGTGLNALLSFQQIKNKNKHLYYAAACSATC